MGPEHVPAGPLAIDTDAFSLMHFRKGPWEPFAELLRGHPPAMSFAVVGELLVASRRMKLGVRRAGELEDAIRGCTVLPSNHQVVEHWARLRARLIDRLSGGGVNDLWVAACCLAYELPLMTNNLSDYRIIQGEAPQLRLVHPAVKP